MPSSKITRTVSGCGGAMLAVCIAAAVIHFNDWMKDHAGAVTYIMFISGAIAFACFLIWFFTNETSNGSPATSFAAAVHAPINITVSPNLSNTISQVSSPDSLATGTSAVPPRRTEPEIPHLLVSEVTCERLDCSNQSIRKLPTGTPGLVLWVENPPAAEGKRAKDVRGVAAIICFTTDAGETGRVDRAYWLEHFENQITIEVGHTKGLVIGLIQSRWWMFYSNRRRFRPNPRRTWQNIRNMAEILSVPLEPERLLLMTAIDAEITIISVETGYTIAKAAYRITRGEDEVPFRVEEIILPV